MSKWSIGLSLAMGLTSPDPARAADHRVSMTISYADLDLSQQGDARRLHARVRSAIRKVCAQPRQGVLVSPAESLCRRTAMARARDQIDDAVTLAATRHIFAQGRFAPTAAR